MSNSALNRHTGRIGFLVASLAVAFLCGVALKLVHAHPESKRALFAAGYGVAVLGVFWTRVLESRLRDAGLPRWSFWPYFLVVFTGCLAAHLLKLTSSLETLGLFLVLQIPAVAFSRQSMPAETIEQKPLEASSTKRTRPVRKITPIGAIEFAIYIALIVGLVFVLHLLRSDVAGMGMGRIWWRALDTAMVLLVVPWIFCVRGRFRGLGVPRWYPGFCAIVLVACAALLALRLMSFQQALILFTALQLPAVVVQRRFLPAGIVEAEAADESGAES